MTAPAALSAPTSSGGAPRQPHRPTTTRYWIGGALIAVGVFGAILWVALGWSAVQHRIAGFSRMDTPGSTAIHLRANTKQVLYDEHIRGIADLTATDFQVTAPSGESVPVGAYPYDFRYDVPDNSSHVGRAVASFRSTVAGDYTVSVSGTSVARTVAIGDDLVRAAVPHVIGAGVLFVVGAGSGGTLIWIAARRRRKSPVG